VGEPLYKAVPGVAGSGLPPLLTSLELRPPDPEVVASFWRVVWSYVLAPFRAVAPEGMAELMFVLAVASIIALLLRLYGLRRAVYVVLLGLWTLLLFSLALYRLGFT